MFKILSHFLYSSEKLIKLLHITFYILVADQCSIIPTLYIDNAVYAVSITFSAYFSSLENMHATEYRPEILRFMNTVRLFFSIKIFSLLI